MMVDSSAALAGLVFSRYGRRPTTCDGCFIARFPITQSHEAATRVESQVTLVLENLAHPLGWYQPYGRKGFLTVGTANRASARHSMPSPAIIPNAWRGAGGYLSGPQPTARDACIGVALALTPTGARIVSRSFTARASRVRYSLRGTLPRRIFGYSRAHPPTLGLNSRRS